MQCEICKKKEAIIFVKEVIFGETKTHALCEDCAKKHKETLMPSSMQIDKLIQSLMNFAEEEIKDKKTNKKIIKKQKTKRCEKCGSTYDEVIVSGWPGCEYCYKTFEKELLEIVAKTSKEITYVGDFPKSTNKKNVNNKNDDKEKIIKYKVELNDAIKIEDYEKAAMLRDKIKKLEAKNKKKNEKGNKNDNSK